MSYVCNRLILATLQRATKPKTLCYVCILLIASMRNVKFCCDVRAIREPILISAGSLLSRQAAPLLGIDISSSSVKLVELGRDKAGGLVLERCAIEPLEPGWITDGNIEKFDEVADALRRLVKKSGTRTKNVALALPPSAVITKKITLPGGMTDQELEVQVESEANQYIPFSLDEVSLDFCVMGASIVCSAARSESPH